MASATRSTKKAISPRNLCRKCCSNISTPLPPSSKSRANRLGETPAAGVRIALTGPSHPPGHGFALATQIPAYRARPLHDVGVDGRLFRRQCLYRQVWAERAARTRSGDHRADIRTGAAEAGARRRRAACLVIAIRPGRPGYARRACALPARLHQSPRPGSDVQSELIDPDRALISKTCEIDFENVAPHCTAA